MTLHGPRVLSLIACDLCQKEPVPPHAEHTGSGCDVWRTFQPMAELRRRLYAPFPNGEPGAAWSWKDSDTTIAVADLYDAVILPRLSWADHRAGAQFIGALHRAGKAVIFEVDDDLFSSEINRRIRETVEPGTSLDDLERKRLDRLTALRLCDGVTVSTPRLATVMRSLTDAPVVVVPNAIDDRWFTQVVRAAQRQVPGLTVGWAGGARPDDDLEAVFWAWGQLAQTHPALTFVVAGHQPDALARSVPDHRVRRLPWLPPEAYPLLLAEIDIACCSVADQPFNRCKSVIKLWESTLAGSAVCASPTLYGQGIDDGVDGLLAESPAEWLAQLTRLVESKDLRKTLRRNQRERIARRHTLAGTVARWPDAWSLIVSEFRSRRTAPQLVLAGR